MKGEAQQPRVRAQHGEDNQHSTEEYSSTASVNVNTTAHAQCTAQRHQQQHKHANNKHSSSCVMIATAAGNSASVCGVHLARVRGSRSQVRQTLRTASCCGTRTRTDPSQRRLMACAACLCSRRRTPPRRDRRVGGGSSARCCLWHKHRGYMTGFAVAFVCGGAMYATFERFQMQRCVGNQQSVVPVAVEVGQAHALRSGHMETRNRIIKRFKPRSCVVFASSFLWFARNCCLGCHRGRAVDFSIWFRKFLLFAFAFEICVSHLATLKKMFARYFESTRRPHFFWLSRVASSGAVFSFSVVSRTGVRVGVLWSRKTS